MARCTACGGGLPGEVPDRDVCRCGSDFASPALFEAAQLARQEWETVQTFLLTRAGGRCEAATPWCIAPGGELHRLSREQVSVHHRRPRGAGGTTRTGTHSLANLLLVCGTGTTGCHGWIEHHRAAAEARGLLVRHGLADPAETVVVLPGGRRVRLHPSVPAYLPPGDGIPYALDLDPDGR